MANDIRLTVTAKDDASRVLDGVDSKAKGLGSTFASVGKIAAGFLAANVIAGAAGKVTGFIGDSIKAASDLGESMNAVNVVFGDSAGEILDWGKTAATQAGLSQRAFNQLATPLGAMLKNTGMGMDEVAGKTIDLTKRAADMASVFNTDVEDALTAIQAALRGESDPIEKYGVAVNAAKVEMEAMAMTGKKTAASLTDQEKAAARLALIFKQTDAVAGDFVNTSDQLANKSRIQKARMEELQATIGARLLPISLKLVEVKAKLVQIVATKLVPAIDKAWATFERLKEPLGSVVDFFKELGRLVSLGAAGGEIGGEFTILEEAAFKLGETWRNVLKPAIEEVSKAWELFILGLKGGDAGGELGKLGEAALKAGQMLAPFFEWFSQQKTALLIAVAAAIGTVLVAAFVALGIAAAAAAISVIAATAPILAIPAAVAIAAAAIYLLVKNFDEVKAWFANNWPEIATLISGPFAPLVILATDAFGIRSALEEALPKLLTWMSELPGKMLEALGDLEDLLFEAGKAIIKGLWDGMKEAAPDVLDWVQGLGAEIKKLKGPLEKDRTLLVPEGEAIMQGLATGLSTGFNRNVAPYLSGAAGSIGGAFRGGGGSPALAGAMAPGGFAFNVTTLNIYEKDDREVKDVAFAVTATMQREVRRRGYLLSSSSPTTGTGVIQGRP